jgi:hypothetical protein
LIVIRPGAVQADAGRTCSRLDHRQLARASAGLTPAAVLLAYGREVAHGPKPAATPFRDTVFGILSPMSCHRDVT